MLSYVSDSPEDTARAASELAKKILSAEEGFAGTGCVCIYGDMGAGKTVFAKGFARGFGITEEVSSPTFTIVKEYSGPGGRLCHFDWYRLASEDELYGIGWEDYLNSGAVCLIEWAELIPEAVPENAVHVIIKRSYSPENCSGREINVYTNGEFNALT